MNKFIEKITVILFFGFLICFSFSYVFLKDKNFSENENRVLYNFSSIHIENFSIDVEKYLSDQFIFRDSMVMINTIFKRCIGYYEINNVIFSDDSYLYNHYNYNDNKFLNNNIKGVNNISSKYNNVNLVLIPSSITQFEKYNFKSIENSIIDDIYSKTNTNNIKISNLLNSDDYFKLDHHINHLGAKKIYSYLTKDTSEFKYELVNKNFKGTTYSKSGAFWYKGEDLYKIIGRYDVLDITYDVVKVNSIYDDSKLLLKDKYSYYLGGNHGLVNIRSSNPNGKKIILIRDSYANIITPYLIDSYEYITLIDLRYYKDNLDSILSYDDEIYIFYSLNGFMMDTNLGAIK